VRKSNSGPTQAKSSCGAFSLSRATEWVNVPRLVIIVKMDGSLFCTLDGGSEEAKRKQEQWWEGKIRMGKDFYATLRMMVIPAAEMRVQIIQRVAK
jgi:hypothetical protein